jgi:hypothetical protein
VAVGSSVTRAVTPCRCVCWCCPAVPPCMNQQQGLVEPKCRHTLARSTGPPWQAPAAHTRVFVYLKNAPSLEETYASLTASG